LSTLRIVDINGDGKKDLLYIDSQSKRDYSQGKILLGNGNGTFQPEKLLYVIPYTSDLVIADLNNDRKPDLICVHESNRLVSILLNRWK